MKQLTSMISIAALALTVSSAQAANWTGYGNISEISQQPSSTAGDFVIVASLPDSTTQCPNKTYYHFSVQTERDKRTLSMILTAFAAGKAVRLYVTDTCHAWGVPEIAGVYVKY